MRKYVAETSDRGAHSPATRLCDGPLETGRWCLWTLVRPRGAALGATAPYGTVHATPSIHEPYTALRARRIWPYRTHMALDLGQAAS